MATKLLILLGTKKGLFILESDAARRDWAQRGPYCAAWPASHAIPAPRARPTPPAGAPRRGRAPAAPSRAAGPCARAIARPRAGASRPGGGNEWCGPAVWTSADLG